MDPAEHSYSNWGEHACSVLSRAVEESAYGTAPSAAVWVALEQPGPWGRDAAQQSHLDAELGRHLGESIGRIGGRLTLIRSPGAHPDTHPDRPRQLLVAGCEPGKQWLLSATLASADQLVRLDLHALRRGDRVGVATSLPGPVVEGLPQLLVCTNGRRDVCCAVQGRPLALGAAAQRPGQVWETSHTGGHRFAPTGVFLPTGTTLGRLSVADAVAALDAIAAGRLPVHLSSPLHDRGRCGLAPAAQAAESAVRYAIAEERLAALRTVTLGQEDEAFIFRVEHVDGGSWKVRVHITERGARRPVSCGKEAQPQRAYDVDLQRA